MAELNKKYATYNLTTTQIDNRFFKVKSVSKQLPILIEGEHQKSNNKNVSEDRLKELMAYRESLVLRIDRGELYPSHLTAFDVHFNELVERTMYNGMTPAEILAHRKKSRIDRNKNTVENVKRIVRLNHCKHMKAITLTYRNEDRPHWRDTKKVAKDFNKFFERLRKEFPNNNLNYIRVIETDKDINPHIHGVTFGMPYISNNQLSKIWGKGYVKIENIENKFEETGAYITKGFEDYITKALGDRPEELRGQRLMTMSLSNKANPKGLKKPNTSRQNIDRKKHEQFYIELEQLGRKYTALKYEQVDYNALYSKGEEITFEVNEYTIPMKDYRALCKKHGVIVFAKNTTTEEVTKNRKERNESIKKGLEVKLISRQERENDIRN